MQLVRDELKHRKAPPAVQRWIADPPSWAEINQTTHVHDPSMEPLDAGEEDAIALAVELHADLIQMDDRDDPEQGVSRRRYPPAFFPWRRHMVLLISQSPLNASSGPTFITGKMPSTSYSPTRRGNGRHFYTLGRSRSFTEPDPEQALSSVT